MLLPVKVELLRAKDTPLAEDGRTKADRVTIPAKVLMLVRVMVVELEEPWGTINEAGNCMLVDRVKDCWVTVIPTATEWIRLGLPPVAFTTKL